LARGRIQGLVHGILVRTGGIWLAVGYSDWLKLSRYGVEVFGSQLDTVTGSCCHGTDWRYLARGRIE
jgi:hypothetical protein